MLGQVRKMTINVALIEVAKVIGALGTVGGVVVAMLLFLKKLAAGMRCILRSNMLQIYYRYEDHEQIPQYQYENFVQLYEAYKALKGNSFVDKIYKDIQEWEVVSKSSGGKK